jgi:co-chaperonin GroES (HSP10)
VIFTQPDLYAAEPLALDGFTRSGIYLGHDDRMPSVLSLLADDGARRTAYDGLVALHRQNALIDMRAHPNDPPLFVLHARNIRAIVENHPRADALDLTAIDPLGNLRMAIRPLGDYVVITVDPPKDQTDAWGIALPQTAQEVPCRGQVVAVGSDVKNKTLVYPGASVSFLKFSGSELTIDGVAYQVLSERNILINHDEATPFAKRLVDSLATAFVGDGASGAVPSPLHTQE